jgi:hypothetical protein
VSIPSTNRSNSSLERRAIGAVAHLLVAGIWLERQFGNAPRALVGLFDEIRLAPSATRSPQ